QGCEGGRPGGTYRPDEAAPIGDARQRDAGSLGPRALALPGGLAGLTGDPAGPGKIDASGRRRAGVAHLVERDLAKVEVAGSKPVSRSSSVRRSSFLKFLIVLTTSTARAAGLLLGCSQKSRSRGWKALAQKFSPNMHVLESAIAQPDVFPWPVVRWSKSGSVEIPSDEIRRIGKGTDHLPLDLEGVLAMRAI